MKKTKKIYRYENRMVKQCNWCEGTRGEWKRVKVLVSEEEVK